MYRLQRTDDYRGLTELFLKNGLEIDVRDESKKELVQAWEMIEVQTQKRVGGMALEKRAGEYVLSDMAIEEPYRGNHLGAQMLDKAIQEVGRMGGKKIFLVAKIPDFYKKWKFETMDIKKAPNITNCATCEQFNKECFPEVMCLDL